MSNIIIDDGREAITINGDPDRVIYIQPTDFNIRLRNVQARKNINSLLAELDKAKPENEEAFADLLESVDKQIKEQINYIFNYDVSKPVFGLCSPLMALKNGKSYVQVFLEAISPIIEKASKEAEKASEKRIAKHTAKYSKK